MLSLPGFQILSHRTQIKACGLTEWRVTSLTDFFTVLVESTSRFTQHRDRQEASRRYILMIIMGLKLAIGMGFLPEVQKHVISYYV